MNSYSIQATSTAANVEIVPTNQKRKLAGAWSFMSPPTKLDVKGGRRAPKAFESSKKAFDYLIVLDFEWTCDDKKFGPAEIIEFPSVLLSGKFPFDYVSETQHYVRPIQHQKLTEFCKNLTGITQGQVDNGADLRATLLLYHDWLHVNGLVGNDITTTYSTKSNGDNVISNNSSSIGYGSTGSNSSSSSNNIGDSISMDIKDNCDRKVEKKSVIAAPTLQSKTVFPSFCIITWGDSDIGTILKEQCIRHSIELPSYFGEWINLKSTFKRHFGWEPHGGLQRVVERCGFSFDGRAHSGLVDSVNTAKIVKKMLKEGFQFFRSTSQIRTYGFRGKREPGENQKHRNIYALSSTLL